MQSTYPRVLVTALGALLLGGVGVAWAGGPPFLWTCETIGNTGSLDPLGAEFGARFEEPAINGSGDVVFHAKAKGIGRRLYLAPGGGAPSVLATQGEAAPGGGSYTRFGSSASGNAPLSINDAGDVGFFGDLDVGEAVFVKPSGLPIEAAAHENDPVPGGGIVDRFHAVSRVNAAGNVAFFAKVAGAANGIFLYDPTSDALSKQVAEGAPATDGRSICTIFRGLGLTDGDEVVFHAGTKLDCLNGAEPSKAGIYRTAGASIERVALVDDATPLAGTTYGKFFGSPEVNSGDDVLLRARTKGAHNVNGLFLYAGGATTLAVERLDTAPVSGGTLRGIATPGGVTDSGRVLFRSSMAGGTSSQGVFFFGGVDEYVVLKGDAVPLNLPPFGPGSIYRKLNPDTGASRSGEHVTFSARVRDTTTPRSSAGVFRCQGS
jgi:hypothetical protein